MPKVDRTEPGSRNDWRITYDTGSQKWTNDRPGDGVGESGAQMLDEEMREPAVQRGMNSVAKALQGGSGLENAVSDMVRDIGKERSRVVLRAMSQAAKRAGAPKGVVDGIEGAREMVAGIKDVVNKIFKVFNVDKAKEIAERVVNFWRTKNKDEDLTPEEQRRIYRPVDYSDTLPLTKKKRVDVNWTDHAEYRSDLRNVDPEKVNEAVRDRLREKLNPPVKQKQNFKEPGVGTMVVDYDTRKNPAEADIVTVWASVRRRAVAAVMDRVDLNDVKTLWYENEDGDKFFPDFESGSPGVVPKGYDYQHSMFSDLRHSILKMTSQEDVDACRHPDDFIRKDHGYDPAFGEQQICDRCGGCREKKIGEDWGPWRGEGSREIMVFNSGWADDLALAMANKGIPLHKAIIVAASACERCMNALAFECGLDWGYPEMSDEWKKCGTECEFCEGMGYSGRDRLVARDIAAYSYGCVMAMLPDELASRIREFGKLIREEDLYDDGSGEHGVEDKIHVTVKYGLHTNDPEDVREVLRDNPPVTAKLGRMSVFHNDDYVVLKMDVDSPGLHEMNGKISGSLKCTDSFPVYHPHVTVAYLRHRKGDEHWYRKLFTDIFEGEEFELDKLLFSTADDRDYWVDLTGSSSKAASRVAMVERVSRRFVTDAF